MMAAPSHCSSCGSRNKGNLSYCTLCGDKLSATTRTNPINSASFRSQKLVVFDIDQTILNTSQRHKDAERAQVITKEGGAKRTGMQLPGKAQARAQQFLFKKSSLAKDTVMPGALELMDFFINKGYVIAYISGRSYKHYEATRDQLHSKGFQLFQSATGKDLLILNNKPGISNKATFKRQEFVNLQGQYDIVAVFDDTVEVLEEAAKLGIPGVYPSIDLYWSMISPRSNPGWGPQAHVGPKGPYVTGTENIEAAYKALPDPDIDPADPPQTVGETSYMPEEDSGQSSLDDFKRTKSNPANPPDDGDWGDWTNEIALGSKKSTYPQERFEKPPKQPKPSVKMIECSSDKCSREEFEDTLSESGLCRRCARSNPANSCKVIIKLKNKTQSDKVNKVRTELRKRGIEFDSDITGGKYPKVRTWFLDFSLKGGTAKQVIAQLKKAKIPHKVEQVKSNPANPSKVSKGKELYKHMNGKAVGKQTVEMIDIGDVWYQVGEGGCWSIGYMSGKETNKKDQKYIHNFNEETKDGNTPKLYATMPENGKPLLIIKGGTWKIKTDDTGTAWIYD